MDWRLFVSTFSVVFLAELGDKTQLSTLSLALQGGSRWVVFAASAAALVTSSALAVLVADGVARWIPAVWLRRGGGMLLVVMGAWMLLRTPPAT